MRTPAGTECPHFYGDYHRGREHEECRLLPDNWKPKLCENCPVPNIVRANSCKHMHLQASVERSIFTLFQERVNVHAWCEKTQQDVAKPEIGCGECHTLPPIFEVKE